MGILAYVFESDFYKTELRHNMGIFSKSLFIIIFLYSEAIFSEPRFYTGRDNEKDDGAIHSLGNGKMCVYEQGPDLVTVYSGPLSTPSFYKLRLIASDSLQIRSIRKLGTAIWNHQILSCEDQTGEMVDFVDAEIPCFVRTITTDQKIVLKFRLKEYVQVIENSTRWKDYDQTQGLLLVVSPGTVIYQTYVYPEILYNQLLCQGAISIQKTEDPHVYNVICEKGTSKICLIGGPDYPEVTGNTVQALSAEIGRAHV